MFLFQSTDRFIVAALLKNAICKKNIQQLIKNDPQNENKIAVMKSRSKATVLAVLASALLSCA